MLRPGTYDIQLTIVISRPGIKLRGYGGAGFDTPPLAPATNLAWNPNSGNGPVVELKPCDPAPLPGEQPAREAAVLDLELSHLVIDGGGVAKTGLRLNRVGLSRFVDVNVRNLLVNDTNHETIGIHLTTDTTKPGVNVGFNYFESCAAWGASKAVVLDGNELANSNMNMFVNLIPHYRGTDDSDAGIWLKHAGDNSFYRVTIYNDGPERKGHGVVIEDPWAAIGNYFYHLIPSRGVYVKNSTQPVPFEGRMMIYSHSIGTDKPFPSTDSPTDAPPEKHVFWADDRGEMHGMPNLTVGTSYKAKGKVSVSSSSVEVHGVEQGENATRFDLDVKVGDRVTVTINGNQVTRTVTGPATPPPPLDLLPQHYFEVDSPFTGDVGDLEMRVTTGRLTATSLQIPVYPSWISRDLAHKLAESPSVLDFGAKGDGVTDDTAALQAAIENLWDKGPIIFPRGFTFKHTGVTISSKPGIHLCGGGKLVLADGANAASLSCSGSTRMIIEDLEIHGNRANQTGTSHGISITEGGYSVVRRCFIHDHHDDGVLLLGTGGGMADEIRILDCYIQLNGGNGVCISLCGDHLIANCHIDFNESFGLYGYGVFSLNVANNNFLTNHSHGIVLQNTAGYRNRRCLISQNQVRNNYRHGIYLIGSDNCVVAQNDCHHNSSTSAGTYSGINLTDCLNCTVLGNLALDPTDLGAQYQKYGLELLTTTTQTVIVGNVLLPNLTGGAALVGAYWSFGNNGLDDNSGNNTTLLRVAINTAIDSAYMLKAGGDAYIGGILAVNGASLAELRMKVADAAAGKLLADGSYVYLRNAAGAGLAINQSSGKVVTDAGFQTAGDAQVPRLGVGTVPDASYLLKVAGGTLIDSLALNYALALSNGGTGATSAAGACGNLGAPFISSGSGAPATTPGKVGDIYIDTSNAKVYVATGTSSSADWKIVN